MALWVFVGFVVLSASFIWLLGAGPFKATPSARWLRLLAFVQLVAAALLVGARLLGLA